MIGHIDDDVREGLVCTMDDDDDVGRRCWKAAAAAAPLMRIMTKIKKEEEAFSLAINIMERDRLLL